MRGNIAIKDEMMFEACDAPCVRFNPGLVNRAFHLCFTDLSIRKVRASGLNLQPELCSIPLSLTHGIIDFRNTRRRERKFSSSKVS